MSEANAVNPTTLSANAQPAVDEAVEVKTPTKRTPKRKADAFQKESEELLKTLGVSVDMEDGRRRTRSSARGGGVVATPVTPATPPAKRARGTTTTPKRGQEAEAATTPNSKTATPKKRGHVEPKNLMKSHEPEEEPQESVVDSTDSAAEAAKMDTAKQPEPSVVVKADKPPQSDGVDTVEKVVPQQDGDKKELAASETKQSTAEVEPTPDRKVEERSSAQKPAVEEVQTKEEDKTTKNDVQSKAVDAGASQTDGAPVEEKMDVDVVSGDKSSEAANDAPQANVSKT
ncbi:nucleolin-like, partial [Anopheles nili]|uniref:nucleolin-like n=1 Tax=Anopheles nili TaxID=185578 RepID=UPI00237C4184